MRGLVVPKPRLTPDAVERGHPDASIDTNVTGRARWSLPLSITIAKVNQELQYPTKRRVQMNGNTAVTTGRITEKVRRKDRQEIVDYQYRFTSMYVKQNDRWRQVAMQLTSIAQ